MTKYFGVREAKAHLSRLLTDVAAGEQIVITRRGVEVASLVAVGRPGARTFRRGPGAIRRRWPLQRLDAEPGGGGEGDRARSHG
jgi:prevent-host-death family protein